jgi:hypothetical protein
MRERRFPALSVIGWLSSTDQPNGGVRAVNHQIWLLTIIAAVLYGFILRDIAREVHGE